MPLIETRHGSFEYLISDFAFHHTFGSGNGWDEQLLGIVLNFVSLTRCVVDVGAHIGTHTVAYARKSTGGVFAYEPQAVIYEILVRNLIRNGLQDRVVAKRAAVGHQNYETRLAGAVTDGPNAGVALQYDANISHNLGGVQLGVDGESVHQVALDEEELVNVGFLKLDIEGAEPLAMYGARKLIARDRPVVLFEQNHKRFLGAAVEAHKIPMDAYTFDFAAYLQGLGYASPIEITTGNYLVLPEDSEMTSELLGVWIDESSVPYTICRGLSGEIAAISVNWQPNLLFSARIDGELVVIGRFGASIVVGQLREGREILWQNGGHWHKMTNGALDIRPLHRLFRFLNSEFRLARRADGIDALAVLNVSRLAVEASMEILLVGECLPGFAAANPTLFRNSNMDVSVGVRAVNYQLIDRRSPDRGSSQEGYIRSLFVVGQLRTMLAVESFDIQVGGRWVPPGQPWHSRSGATGLEDVKAIRLSNETVGVATISNHKNGVRQMAVVRFGDSGEIDSLYFLKGDLIDPARDEKNWMPFEMDSGLLVVYSINPLTILSVNSDGHCQTVVRRSATNSIPRSLRGSSPGVALGNRKYLFVAHEVFDCVGLTSYAHRFIVVDTESWEVSALSAPFCFQGLQVEFCCGLLEEGNDLLISYSIGDSRAYVCRIPISRVFAMLAWGDP